MAIFRMNDAQTHLILFEFPGETGVNVGINNDLPTERLDVGGAIRCDGIVSNGTIDIIEDIEHSGTFSVLKDTELSQSFLVDSIIWPDLTTQNFPPTRPLGINGTFTIGGKVFTVTKGQITSIV